jgi:hypothetical protein
MPALKPLVRAAARIHRAYTLRQGGTGQEPYHLTLVLSGLDQLRRTRRSLQSARSRGWRAAAAIRYAELLAQLKALAGNVQQSRQALERTAPAVPRFETVVEELRQLANDFATFDIDLRRKVVSVTTEPITLDGVSLGRFCIELLVERLACPEDVPIQVVALEPNPAQSDSLVTHPHVRRDRLCPGDATVPLKRALADARLADAFHLVHGVLAHYNAHSPHVHLEDWGGTAVSADEVEYCGRCRHALCINCSRTCERCGRVRCPECAEHCAVCESVFCNTCLAPSAHSGKRCCARCLRTCAGCTRPVTRDELDPATRLCPACLARWTAQPSLPQTSNPDPIQPETADEDPSLAGAAA